MGSPAWLPETPMPAANATGNAATVLAYHERSKHRLERHASGPETLDWDAQPDPFCRFAGAPLTRLPLPTDDTTHWTSLFSPGAIAPHAATLESLGLLFELSFALSAWKRLGPDRWLLRCNPSSGNHPTEIYARAGWEIWMKVCTTTHQRNTRWNDAPGSRASNSTPVCRVCWSASVQSTGARWKYGERAFRYRQLDVGHAIGALRYACAVLGWRVHEVRLAHVPLATLLGLDRADDFDGAEREEPEALFELRHTLATNAEAEASEDFSAWMSGARWSGNANRLDARPMYRWPVLDEVAQASRRTGRLSTSAVLHGPRHRLPRTDIAAATLVRARRSAQRFDRHRRKEIAQ